MIGCDSMRTAYECLYEPCREEAFQGKEVAVFVGMKPKRNHASGIRLMLIGRAVNGWGTELADMATRGEKDRFLEEVCHQWECADRWNWMEEKNEKLYNTGGKQDCVGSRPFWSYAEKIWRDLTGDNNSVRWVDYIYWTNLYKISPANGGNPTDGQCKAQGEACREILRQEIEACRPTHILCFTDDNWITCQGYTDFGVLFMLNATAGQVTDKTAYVKLTGEYQYGCPDGSPARVMITCRPEYKVKDEFCKAVEEKPGWQPRQKNDGQPVQSPDEKR